ncbi:MAG: glycosyltransferase family 87 protein [Sphingomonadaceae bacterium]
MDVSKTDSELTTLPTRLARNPFWLAAWIIPLALILSVILFDISTTLPNGSIHGAALWGRDFVNVYTSGHLVWQGKFGILYDVDAYRAFQDQLFGPGRLKYHNYSYPPVSLLYTPLFALLPYYAALVVWLSSTGALFIWAARPYLKSVGLPAALAIFLPASIVNMWAGHYGFLIGALWLGAWNLLDRRPLAAGALIGAMIVKPHLAVLAPFMLAARGEWRAFAAAALTALGLIGLSALIFGPELWLTYLTTTAGTQAAMVNDVGTFFILMMPTVVPQLSILGAPLQLALILQAIVALVAVTAVLRSRHTDSQTFGLAGAVATFLVLPYAFSYDMTAANLACLIAMTVCFGQTGHPWQKTWLALAFTLPVTILTMSRLDIAIAPLILAGALYAMTRNGQPHDSTTQG